MNDKKVDSDNYDKPITSNELEYILDVNRKAISIYNEVAKQNDDIIQTLETIQTIENNNKDNINENKIILDSNKEILSTIYTKVESIDKSLLTLVVIFSTIGVSTIVELIVQLVHLIHK